MFSLFKKLFRNDNTFGAQRSPRWSSVREHHLYTHPLCAICGSTKNVVVHHKKPFHLYPQLELDPSNLVTLCESDGMNCHITFGHLGNFRSYNLFIDDDIKLWSYKILNRP